MPARQKSNLSLHRPKRRMMKRIQRKSGMHFVLSKEPITRTMRKGNCTPQRVTGMGSLKRLSVRSPHPDLVRTPSKSPFTKKARVSLFHTVETEDASETNGTTVVDGNVEVIVRTPSKSPFTKKAKVSLFHTLKTEDSSKTNGITAVDENFHCIDGSDYTEIEDLLPGVLDKLREVGFDSLFMDFCRQVRDGTFPLTNIAFLLWMDVIKWYSCENTSFMRYSEDTKKFWKLGYRLFGGKFLNFMSGFKLKQHNGEINEESMKGIYSPFDSDINFAVPDAKILRDFQPYNIKESEKTSSRKPGILRDMVDTMSKAMNGDPCCLTFDGKKLKQGLTETSGEVDILGYETGPSISDRLKNLESRIDPVEIMRDVVQKYDRGADINSLTNNEKGSLKQCLIDAMTLMSSEILDMKEIRKRKEYAKEKWIERGGESNWKNSKFAYAISSMIAFVHDIDRVTNKSLAAIDEILSCVSSLNGISMLTGNTINLLHSHNYVELVENDHQSTRDIKQRTEAWFKARQEAKVTGSTIYRAVGIDGLANQKEHFDNIVCKIAEKEKSEETKKALQHGTENEPNAMATLVCKIMPTLFPGGKACEEGYIEIGKSNNKPFMIVSPDGSIRTTQNKSSTVAAIELKCPMLEVHKKIPNRYLLQYLSEIEALDVPELIYLSWRPDISSVFRVKRNTELFNEAYELANDLYNSTEPKRPTKLSDKSKRLKEQIEAEINTSDNVEFIGIVPSVCHDKRYNNDEVPDSFKISRVIILLEEIVDTFKRIFDLKREPASEAVAFLCCDLDRKWEEGNIRSAPVCWFPKGYSLNTETMRKVLEAVLNECYFSGLQIPAISFDGQWHNICVRSQTGKPLTLLQLQKDVWKKVENTPKSAILKGFKSVNKCPRWQRERNENDKTVIKAYQESEMPKVSASVAAQRKKEQKKNDLKESRVQNNKEIQSSYNEQDCDQQGIHENENRVPNTINPSDKEEPPSADSDTLHQPVQNGNNNNQKRSVSEEDAKTILTMLKTDKKCNCKGQWNDKGPAEMQILLESYSKMKALRDIELKIVIRFLNRTKRAQKIKESLPKQEKLYKLCQILGTPDAPGTLEGRNKKRKTSIRRLDELALAEVSRTLRKSDLNIVYAEYIWATEVANWKNSYPFSSQITDLIRSVEETESKNSTNFPCVSKNNEEWFYSPDFSESRNKLEVSCVDSTHLLTRARRKCCKGGLDGLPNSGWRHVAKSNKTSLSLAMIDCVFEPMSVSAARTHFSEAVEKELYSNGYVKEANLCKDLRNWWQAEDDRGISAIDRIKLRLPLRNRLLSYIDFARFPPPGMFVNGWPTQLWEALVANIDSKILLYYICERNTYNVRAFSSMMGETYFAELTLNDRRGHGTLTVDEFGQFINSTVEKLHMRIDPKRKFAYRVSRKTAYTLVEKHEQINEASDEKAAVPISDHHFDRSYFGKKSKNKENKIKCERNAVKRGSLGVRWEKARRDESKLLPTLRLGIDS